MKCNYHPEKDGPIPIGMYHCPECGEMVMSGLPHPDYDSLDEVEEEEEGEE